jgi:hypothetical protein
LLQPWYLMTSAQQCSMLSTCKEVISTDSVTACAAVCIAALQVADVILYPGKKQQRAHAPNVSRGFGLAFD